MKLVLGILLGILGTFLYLDPAGTADTLEKYASEGREIVDALPERVETVSEKVSGIRLDQ